MMPLCHATGEPSALPLPFARGGSGCAVPIDGWSHDPLPASPLAGGGASKRPWLDESNNRGGNYVGSISEA